VGSLPAHEIVSVESIGCWPSKPYWSPVITSRGRSSSVIVNRLGLNCQVHPSLLPVISNVPVAL